MDKALTCSIRKLPPRRSLQPPSGFRLSNVSPVQFLFTSAIELPPDAGNNGWQSSVTTWAQMKGIVTRYTPPTGFQAPPDQATCSIRLNPKPTKQAMQAHILYHERQHVADNKWIVEKAFKPWVDWLDTLAQSSNAFYTAKQKSTLEWFIGGGAYATYWGKYLFDLSKEVGEHYHRRTDAGAAPIYEITGIAKGLTPGDGDYVLLMDLKPKLALSNISWDSPPHQYFKTYTIQDYASGSCDQVIANAGIPVPDWTPAVIALNQASIDKFEQTQVVTTDEEQVSAFSMFD